VLNWRENQFSFILSPGNTVGDPVTLLTVVHPPPSLGIVNQAVTGPPNTGDGTNVYFYLDSNYVYLRGSLAIDVGKTIPLVELYEIQDCMLQMSFVNRCIGLMILSSRLCSRQMHRLKQYLIEPHLISIVHHL
jgi:hypothetical protein